MPWLFVALLLGLGGLVYSHGANVITRLTVLPIGVSQVQVVAGTDVEPPTDARWLDDGSRTPRTIYYNQLVDWVDAQGVARRTLVVCE